MIDRVERVWIVRGCSGCPAYHQGMGGSEYCGADDGRAIECSFGVPKWCPLRSGPIRVRLHPAALLHDKVDGEP